MNELNHCIKDSFFYERSEVFMSKANFNIKELLKIDKLNHFEINSF